MTIGDFAARTHLTIRTLRHYHEAGLLEPASVDPASGYRYYTADQIPTARLVHRLRELDLSIPEIRTILSEGPTRRAEIVSGHLARLEDELRRTRSSVTALRRLLDPEAPALDVDVRTVPARSVAAVRDVVTSGEVADWFAAASERLDVLVPPDAARGPLAGEYASTLFTQGSGAATLYRPVGDGFALPAGSGVTIVRRPALDVAVTVHVGSHDTVQETYGELARWVDAHALGVGDAVHETYLVGPRDTPEESAWRTEIGWAILRIGSQTADDPARA